MDHRERVARAICLACDLHLVPYVQALGLHTGGAC